MVRESAQLAQEAVVRSRSALLSLNPPVANGRPAISHISCVTETCNKTWRRCLIPASCCTKWKLNAGWTTRSTKLARDPAQRRSKIHAHGTSDSLKENSVPFDLFCELLLQMPRAFVGRLSPPRQTSLRSPSVEHVVAIWGVFSLTKFHT